MFCVYCLQFEHRFGPDISLYLGLVKDGVELHLSEHYGDTTLGTRVPVAVTDIHGFYKDLMSRPFKNLTPGPPQEQSWGGKDLTLTYPFPISSRFMRTAHDPQTHHNRIAL
ncbi:glyoxalase superfamily protein [Cognatiyoonia sp.]|uniref:glyoxalase superfamily protein n=1 Tax=Cognatiyoonia sp. TaxID=2211652 RepID=UPI003F69FEC7